MSVYSDLLALGYTHEQIIESPRSSTRQFSVMAVETPDGEPLVGVGYTCDFRYEEEAGYGKLYGALIGDKDHQWQMDSRRTAHISHFDEVPSLILSTDPMDDTVIQHWGHDVGTERWSNESGSLDHPASRGGYDFYYDSYWEGAVSSARGLPAKWKLEYTSVADLRAELKGKVKPLPTKKDDLIKAYLDLQTPETPNVWPGWFHFGRKLILRADSGIAADVLNLLYAAGKAGTLAIGGGSMGFGSDIGIYDGADVGRRLRKQRHEAAKAKIKAAKALEPVKAELKKRGHDWYSLDRASVQDGVTHYWLNGVSVVENGKRLGQPYGWYTLQELLDEKFMTDLRERDNGK